jgi:hypothetical protein
MVREKDAETLGRIWRLSFDNYFIPLAIIVLLLFMVLSCARGGGTPVSSNPEGGMPDSTIGPPVVDTGPEAATQYCGNGVIDPDLGEQCDVNDLGQETCASLTNGQQEGDLGCLPDCTFNMIMCYDVAIPDDPGVGGSYGGG